ncbi:TetR/AcrR family transcriptional regulator [soil metagenome]
MPRAGLSNDVVLEEAARILDEKGEAGLSLAALAESLGVRVPSLYKHVNGMPAIQRGMVIAGKTSLGNALGQAAIGKSREDAITAMSFAYRAWALQHPGQYPLTMHTPVAGDEQDLAASASFLAVVFTVLAGYDLRDDDAVDAARFLRATLHGFVSLETAGGFEMPVDIERSFTRLVESVVTALSEWSRSV